MFYNARYYDSALGRFASADTIVPGGVQGLDKYAYANNSPVVYNDPTGHCPICVLAWVAVNADAITSVAIAAFVVVASVSGANDAYQSGDINGALQNLAMLPVAGVVGTSGLSEMESKVILPEEQAPLISEESIFLRGIKKSYSIDDPEAYYLRKCLKS